MVCSAILVDVEEISDSDGIVEEINLYWLVLDDDGECGDEEIRSKSYPLECGFSDELLRDLEEWLGDDLYEIVDDHGNIDYLALNERGADLGIRAAFNGDDEIVFEEIDAIRPEGQLVNQMLEE